MSYTEVFGEDLLQEHIDSISAEIERHKSDPGRVVQEKLNSLDYHLSRISPLKQTPKGTTSMYSHLQNLRDEIAGNSVAYVEGEINRLQKQLDKLTN